MKKTYLVLANGQVFEGYRRGAEGTAVGELVFTTGMCGYLETLTDPGYYGQIVAQTFPLIGNYGVIPADFEGKCYVRGYVVRELCETPSNFRSEGDLDAYLRAQNVVAICGIDTRQLTRILREQGVMNATICDEIPADLTAVQQYRIVDAVKNVTHNVADIVPAVGERKFRVSLLDYGAARNLVRALTKRGCEVTVLPAQTLAEDILAGQPDGILLSNGPGDPAENVFRIGEIRKLMGKLPIFGVCLGHQLMALAQGGQTAKMKYGHRGSNQPAKEVAGTRTYITTQNHGYAVLSEGVQGGVVSFVNANDASCEGMDYPGLRAFSVQFHPESCDGPNDSNILFDRFIALMGGTK